MKPNARSRAPPAAMRLRTQTIRGRSYLRTKLSRADQTEPQGHHPMMFWSSTPPCRASRQGSTRAPVREGCTPFFFRCAAGLQFPPFSRSPLTREAWAKSKSKRAKAYGLVVVRSRVESRETLASGPPVLGSMLNSVQPTTYMRLACHAQGTFVFLSLGMPCKAKTLRGIQSAIAR